MQNDENARLYVTVGLEIAEYFNQSSDIELLKYFLVTQTVKNLPVMQEIWIWVLGSGISPGEGNGYPLQYSCLENSVDRGAWWAIVHGVTKNQTHPSTHEHIESSDFILYVSVTPCGMGENFIKFFSLTFKNYVLFYCWDLFTMYALSNHHVHFKHIITLSITPQ